MRVSRTDVAQRLGFDDLTNYTGTDDGLSRPQKGWLKPIFGSLLRLEYRVETEGLDQFRPEGKDIYCITHPNMMDPALMGTLIPRDVRSLADHNNFQGLQGQVVTAMGAFPVDKASRSTRPVRHSMELVKEGTALGIYPEGHFSTDPNKVDPLQLGTGTIAVRAGAENLYPVATHYEEEDKLRPLEFTAGLIGSLGLIAGGLYAASLGGPAAIAASAVGGSLAGLASFAAMGRSLTQPEERNPFPRLLNTLKWGAIGATVGALGGGVVAAYSPLAAVGFSVAGGLGAAAVADHFRLRPVARVKAGKPLKVAEVTSGLKKKPAAIKLTEELHRSMGQLKADLTGIAYDENQPKIAES